MIPHVRKMRLFFVLILLASAPMPARADWLADPNPPDVDKIDHGDSGTMTCWLATSANMLASAGYGTGDTTQARADSIYVQLRNHFGTLD